MFGGKHRATHLWVVAIAVVVGCLAFAATSGAATTSGKSKTKVSVEFDHGGTLEDNGYKVTVKKPKNCKRDRKVTVFHDENGNGKLDRGEFVIGKGRTNSRGRYSFESEVAPPAGDKIGVVVKGNKKCKGGKASTTA